MKAFLSKKVVIILLAVLMGLSFGGLIVGGIYVHLSSNDSGQGDDPAYEIRIDESVEIFPDRAFRLAPALFDADGNEITGKFTYEYDSDLLLIDRDGVVTVLQSGAGEVTVKIIERKTGLEKTIRLQIIDELDGVLEIRLNGVRVPDALDLEIGTSYTFEVVTMPSGTDVSDYLTVVTQDASGAPKQVLDVSVEKNLIHISPKGLGSGTLRFVLENKDRNVKFKQSTELSISLPDAVLTESILAASDESLMDLSDMGAVERLVFPAELTSLPLEGIELLTGLKTVVLQGTTVVDADLTRIPETVVFRVNGLSTYEEYAKHEGWKDRKDLIYPYLEKTEEMTVEPWELPVVVYHNEESYRLLNVAGDGSLPLLEKAGDVLLIRTPGSAEDYTYVSDASPRLVADAFADGYAVRSYQLDGFGFAGWVDAEGAAFDNADLASLTEGIHVYARWTPNTYTVTLEDYIDGANSLRVTHGQKIGLLPTPVKNGWGFVGWYLSENYLESERVTEDTVYRLTEDVTLYAKYETDVVLSYHGVVENLTLPNVVYGKPLGDLLPVGKKGGWDLMGWHSATTYADDTRIWSNQPFVLEARSSATSLTLYAMLAHTVILENHHSELGIAACEPITLICKKTLAESIALTGGTLPVDTLVNGWRLIGWTTQVYTPEKGFDTAVLDASCFINGTEVFSVNTERLYAIYSSKLTLKSGITGGTPIDTLDVILGCRLTVGTYNQAIVPGYTLHGWYLNAKGHPISVGERITAGYANATAYAMYMANRYGISFVDRSGAELFTHDFYDTAVDNTDHVLNNDASSGLNGRRIVLPTVPGQTGYGGQWYYNGQAITPSMENGVAVWYVPSGVFENVTLTASYVPNRYQVHFNDHGTESGLSDLTVTFNSSYGVLPTPRVPAGYTFEGWYTDTSYTERVNAETLYTLAADRTLYAKYSIRVVFVAFDGTENEKYFVYGLPTEIEMLSNVGGWYFDGWFDEAGAPLLYDRIGESGKGEIDSYRNSKQKYLPRWVRSITLQAGNGFGLPEGMESLTVVRGKTLSEQGLALPTDSDLLKSGDARAWSLVRWYYLHDGERVSASATDLTLVDLASIDCLYAEYATEVDVIITLPSGTQSTPARVTLILGNRALASLDRTYAELFAAEAKRGYHHVGWRVGTTEYRFTEGGAYANDLVTAAFGAAGSVTALFEANSYAVEYDANGGKTTPAPSTQLYGTAFRLPAAIERVGYRFLGWKLGDTCYEAGTEVRNLAVDGSVRLVAQWEIISYTVTFTDHTGATFAERTYTVENRVFDTPELPLRTGYLVEWAEFAEKLAGAAESFEVKALYTPIEYTVTYDPSGSTDTVEDQLLAYDNAGQLVFANAVSRLGYTFEGWKYGDQVYAAGELIPNLCAENGATVQMVAQWKLILYPLTYVIDGETVATSTYHVEMTAYLQPDIPLRRGYRSYWSFDSLKSLNAETVGFTIEAVYVAIPYSIRYVSNGELFKTVTYTVETVERVEAPHEIPTNRLGYTFVAWEAFDRTTLGDQTLHAIWAPIEYTLVFRDAEDVELGSFRYTVEDESIASPAVPERIGYIGSWGIDRESLLTRIAALESGSTALSFKPVYTPRVYSVTLENGSATERYPYTVEQLQDGKLTLVVPTPQEGFGYVADVTVHSYDADTHRLVLSIERPVDVTVRAIPVESASFAITLDHGYGGIRQTKLYSEGEAVSLPTLSREGYQFLGWYLGDAPVTEETLPASTVILTAKWQAIQYTVILQGYEEQNLTLSYGQTLTLPTPDEPGYRFLGWYLGQTRYVSGMKNLTAVDGEILTLTPAFEPISYTVRYDSTGGKSTPTAQTVLYGSSFHLPAAPTRAGYIFLGWRVGDDRYEAGLYLNNLTDVDHGCVTVTAEWRAIQYTVIFDGSELDAAVWSYDQAYALPKPTRSAYEFLGWEYLGETHNSGKELMNLCADDGATVVLKALWKPNAYGITFQYSYMGSIQKQTVYFNVETLFVNEPLPIAKEGYAVGWACFRPEGGITVEAVQLEGGYTLTYVLGDSRAYRAFLTEEDLAAIMAMAPALPERAGYDAEWVYVADADGNYTATPRYTLQNTETYQLTVELNGGTLSDLTFLTEQTVAYGSACMLPTADQISRFGYRFVGWSYNGNLLPESTFLYLLSDQAASEVTLVAVWEPIEYTITFRGIVDTVVTYTLDMHPSEIQLPPAALIAQREGYVGQWQLPALTGTDLTVTAVYTPVIFQISFDLGASLGTLDPITLPYGSTFLPARVTRDGYRLVGWELDGTVFRADEPITCRFNVANGTSVTLKAVWEKSREGYTATFVSMGKVVAQLTFTQSDVERGYLLAPTLPAREHYVGCWESYTLTASDLTVHAVWIPVVYELRFLSGATPAEVLDRVYVTAETEALILPMLPQKEGYLASWIKQSETEYVPHYTPISYTLTFESECDAQIKDQTVPYDTDVTLPDAPVRHGYLFGGWKLGDATYTAGQTLRNLTATDGEVLTFTAIWTPEQYTLTLMDGETNVGSITFTVLDTVEQIRERCATYPITARAGYTTLGWNIPNDLAYKSQTVTSAFAVITYKVYFEDSEGNTLTVEQWTVESGTVSEPEGKFIYELKPEAFDERNELHVRRQEVQVSEQTVKFYQQTLGSPTPTLIATRYFSANERTFFIPAVPTVEGYLGQWDLAGIHVTVDGEELQNPMDYLTVSEDMNAVTVSEDIFAAIEGKKLEIRINALYTPIKYTILYDALGGTAVEPTEITYNLEGQTIGGASERLGYLFRGWYCARTGRTYAASSELEDVNAICKEQGGEVTFTAVWEPIRYTVQYQMNGGSTVIPDTQASYDRPFNLPAVPERLNYRFVCWDINGVRYDAEAELINLLDADGESILAEAIWEIRSYTVTFLDEGGTALGSCTYTVEDKTVTEPALPQKLGYTVAWEDYSSRLADNSALSDFTVSLCYTPISYRVTYNANGGSSTPDAVEATYETVWTLADAVERHGYDFVGWRMGERLFKAGTEISALVTESGSYELTAEWKPTVYRVFFMAHEAGAEELVTFAVRTYTVESPDFDLPPLPAGYLAWAMPGRLTPDAEIYPVAETEDCVITFVNEQGEVVASLIAARGEPLQAALPAVPAKVGYRGSWILPDTVENDLTVRPHYEVITYKAYFYDENGNLVKLTDEDGNEYEYSEYTVLDGKLITPAVPEKAHFRGAWNLPSEMVGDLEITVLYTPILYKVTYLVDGVATFERYYTILNQDIADPIVPEKIGFVPMGWTEYDLLQLTDQTVEARYVTSQYSVRYDPNGGSSTPDPKDLVYEDLFNVADAIERTGYVFLGWRGSDGVLYEAGAQVSRLTAEHLAVFTLTAEWREIVYHVDFPTNGDSTPAPMRDLTYEQMITLPDAVTRTGYLFTGWILPDGSTRQPGEQVNRLTATDGATVTVTPNWKPITYTVHFNTQGGSPVDSIVATYDTPFALPSGSTLTGYDFNGWELGGVLYSGSADVVNLAAVDGASVTMNASFVYHYYTIHYDSNGGSLSGEYVTSFTIIDTVSSLPTPSRGGHTFNGWYENGQAVGSIAAGTARDVYLTAGWTVIPDPPKDDGDPCVATGTLVTLAGGTTKRVEELKGDETLLVWDFVSGSYVERPIVFLYYHGENNYILINLTFSDGTTVQVVGKHGFYDPDLKQFVLITAENCQNYIGHRFAKMNGCNSESGAYSYVTLVDAFVEEKYTGSYSVWTAQSVNFITNGMLSLTPLEFSFFEKCFEYGDNMMFDQAQMQADIEKYGVYTYEEWSEYMTYEQFLAFNGPYIKVAVGKGLTTEEELLMLIREYLPREGESNIRG